MNSTDIYDTTLQFETDAYSSSISLKCDNLQYYPWSSTSYGQFDVTSEQRRSLQCSDTNFTIQLSNDFNKEEILISVYDAKYFKKIAIFKFLSDNTYVPITPLTEDQAQLSALSYTNNDFNITLYTAKTIYLEVFKCQNSQSQLTMKGYDSNYLVHNVTKMSSKEAFYDILQANQGVYYYRLSQSYYSSPDVFIKYQTAPFFSIDQNKIKEYGDKYYSVYAYVSSRKIRVSFPSVQVTNNENVEFTVLVSRDAYEGNYVNCVNGDFNLFYKYAQTYSSQLRTFYQQRNYGTQDVEVDFPNSETGWYNVRVTAVVDHGYIKQTITYGKYTVYQDYEIFPDTLLVHILAPIIISCIALIGLIFGACKFSAKKKQMQQMELLQQYQSNINPQY
ncbi:unnamed protein product (macronuclear) [Paramecium tetraurelia]|uniref:Transmembrane protein n=1 Tax=Paramecium tetraurelia TaxID=5888 RepID=A0EF29_PARTE|nr:uncharacterized protein GSPATT00026243001 [Paramecium tetraurelia]CAK93920.1 unnamed protein product [Paramecium tetraurelia]|eukprot:XP_001461293.1 hypothetical protein (macronuclear) [Paramecium tetraurelia strain d4-2]